MQQSDVVPGYGISWNQSVPVLWTNLQREARLSIPKILAKLLFSLNHFLQAEIGCSVKNLALSEHLNVGVTEVLIHGRVNHLHGDLNVKKGSVPMFYFFTINP
jgi:hypothetical protein